MRLTVGPLPPAVYWRRRAFVLGAILLALFLVAQACMAAAASPDRRPGAGGTPTGAPPASPPPETPSPATAAPVPERPTGDPADPADPGEEIDDEDRCTDEEVLITAEAEQTSVAGGTSVQFTIRIENPSDRACLRDVGGGQRELYLRRDSSAGQLWSSRACGDLTGEEVRELPVGFESEHWIVWNGRASDQCEGPEPAGEQLPPGEYELVARLGTAYSDPVVITVR